MKLFLILILVTPILTGCLECGPQKELTLSLSLASDTVRLKKVYAIGAKNQDVFQKQVKPELTRSQSFDLPFSLHADETTYVFEFETRIDSLTVYYNRLFSHKQDCGFIVDVEAPANGINYRSTFDKVGVEYQSYLNGRKGILMPGPGEIRVTVKL